MATDRLSIYNGALQICKQRPVASLTVNEESRRELDVVWDGGGVEYCLEQGQWLFARRSSKFTYDTGITPSFGYAHGFTKPDDFVNLAALCSDEFFNTPLNRFSDEAGVWYADLEEIYVKYTSKDPKYGFNFAKWSQAFTRYVEAYFASRVCGKINSSATTLEEIIKPKSGILAQALLVAQNNNAQGEPARFLPQGGWTKARMRQSIGNWADGGNRNRLIG